MTGATIKGNKNIIGNENINNTFSQHNVNGANIKGEVFIFEINLSLQIPDFETFKILPKQFEKFINQISNSIKKATPHESPNFLEVANKKSISFKPINTANL